MGAAGGLGGFFPPIILGLVKSALGSYTLGYVLLAATAALCLVLNLLILGGRRTSPDASAPAGQTKPLAE